MKKLTEKQQAFVTCKLAGLPNREAAIHAGYSPRGADVAASKLLHHPDVALAIRRGKVQAKTASNRQAVAEMEDGEGESAELGRNAMPREVYEDSMEFLRDAMNLKSLPIAARADYAKSLLPYQHAKIGEKGKKESAKDRAKELTGRDNVGNVLRPRFGTKNAPGAAE